jgi:acyl carrier protein
MNEMSTNLTRDALATLICETLAKRLRKPIEDISLQTRFETLQMDSLDLAEMFFLLEDELKMTIPLDQGVQLESIQDALELILRSLQAFPVQENA